jgi:hypothetical protein
METPEGGWKANTYYKVHVTLFKGNCPHEAIFYTGFLNGRNGGPGGYACIMEPTYDNNIPYNPDKQEFTHIEELFHRNLYVFKKGDPK